MGLIPAPFFSAIVLFENRSPFLQGFWFSWKQDPWKEWGRFLETRSHQLKPTKPFACFSKLGTLQGDFLLVPCKTHPKKGPPILRHPHFVEPSNRGHETCMPTPFLRSRSPLWYGTCQQALSHAIGQGLCVCVCLGPLRGF